MRKNFLTGGCALLLALLTAGTAFAAINGVRLEVASSVEHGSYLTDGRGNTLYLYTADTRGEASVCEGECLETWPALLTEGEPELGPGIDGGLVGTLTRADGTVQVTYGGWPLYTHALDTAPGEVTGHDVSDAGGEWYLISPTGEMVHHAGS